MKKILIDGRFVGVGDSQTRYVLEMLRGILEIDKENEYTLLIRPAGIKPAGEFFGIGKLGMDELIQNSKFKIQNSCFQVLDVAHYSIAEQTKLLSYLNHTKYDLVHFTQFNHPIWYRLPYVVTIQDLTLVGHLHYFNFVKQLAYNMVMRDATVHSKKIIAISIYTKQDVIDFFGTSEDRFELIYHGVDHNRFRELKDKEKRVKDFKEKNKISGDYLVYTGMWKKHKNLIRLLKAYEKFIKNDQNDLKTIPQLVFVGKVDENEPEVLAEIERINNRAIKQSNRKLVLAIGPNYGDDLVTAYAGALAYVIPSLSEGFGWPPLEAMACGTPVIASNISCIPEILGDAALYFDPYNVDDMADAITKICSDSKLREDLIKKGLAQVQKYNWSDAAKKTLEVYKQVLK